MASRERKPTTQHSGDRRPNALTAGAAPVLHLAARTEDAFHEFRERRGRKRGLTPTVIPYTGYGGAGWVRVLARVLLAKPGDDQIRQFKSVRGWRSFVSIAVTQVSVTIRAGGVSTDVMVDRGGVVDAKIAVNLEPGWQTIELSTENSEPVTASVFIVDPAVRFGIISDVDDTVMVTALPRPFLAAWNTFVVDEHARAPVPGMAVLYERLTRAHPGAPVIYLSTGAWNVAPTLRRFLTRNMYPRGPMLLTDWGPTHDRWFRSGREHKRGSLIRLADEFPGLKWLLVGDDGQHDEDLYGEFETSHPQNVEAVAIRQLSPSEAVLAGGRSKPATGIGTGSIQWVFAHDGAGLAKKLSDLDLL